MWEGSWQDFLYSHHIFQCHNQTSEHLIHLTVMLGENRVKLMPKYWLCDSVCLVTFFTDRLQFFHFFKLV